MSYVIFLLGAGATVDAGMPTLRELTCNLRERLPRLKDINDNIRAELFDLFCTLTTYEPEIGKNYECFLEWLNFLQKGQSKSFRKIVEFKLERRLVDAVPYLAPNIRLPIGEILWSRHDGPLYQPSYLTKLSDFLPEKGRLLVFTTNYDLCVEDACSIEGVKVTTGFDPDSGQWNPSLFQHRAAGINLYKLHGSLNWVYNKVESSMGRIHLVERHSREWDSTFELVLGPGSKIQSDDPYATLYLEFHRAIRRAKVCVAIGCSFRDEHLKRPVQQAIHRGMKMIDVNLTPVNWRCDRYVTIRKKAEEAFLSGEILKTVERLTSRR